jgi:hypothetical protein
MRSRLLLTAFLLVGLLPAASCGGGGNDPPPVPTPQDVGTGVPLPVDPDPNETPDQFEAVNSDVFTYTPTTIDRSVAALQFENTAAAPVNLRIRVKSTRALQAPAGVGTSSLFAWVSTMDVTTSRWALVSTDLDRQLAKIDGLAAGQSASVAENGFAVVTVPAGATYTFTSIARSFGHDGATGDRVLTTTDFILSYTVED